MVKTYTQEDEKYLTARLRSALRYDPTTGDLFWAVTRQGGYAVAGSIAGSADKHGNVRVCLDGVNMSAARAIHLYQLGYLPPHRISFRDGNPKNLAWDNIFNVQKSHSQSKVASYRREMRALDKEIDKRIAEGDLSGREALRAGGSEARGVRAYRREEIRRERAKDGPIKIIGPLSLEDLPPVWGTPETRGTGRRKRLGT